MLAEVVLLRTAFSLVKLAQTAVASRDKLDVVPAPLHQNI